MASSAQQPATSPFSPEARIAFASYLANQDLQRRARPTDERHAHIREYLSQSRIAVTQEDRRLKFKAFREYEVLDGRLHTKSGQGRLKGGRATGQRHVPRDEEIFDIITRAHIGLVHPGQDKTFYEIERTTAGISRKEVGELLKHCSTCAKKATQKAKAPIKVIAETVLWGRVQIDLIDMRGDPDEEFKWICHMRDHFSKYSIASPMPSKTSEEVVKVVLTWIMHLGPPKILQSDNGTEFKGALSILLRQYGIQVINGRPRHPQSQGMVEKANHILKDKISAWRSDHQSSSWVCSLPEVIGGMNAQRSFVTGRSPYEVAFGQVPHGARISYLERESEEVPQEGEALDITGSNALPESTDYPTLAQLHTDEDPSIGVPVSTLTLEQEYRLGQDSMVEVQALHEQFPQADEGAGSQALGEGGTETNEEHHFASILDVRTEARETAARNRQLMVTRDLQRNPPPHYPTGTTVTLRIPKKNRNAAQSKRLLCQILGESTTGRYQLQMEYGILRNTYPTSELDAPAQTVVFTPKVREMQKKVTLNFASQQARAWVPAQALDSLLSPGGENLEIAPIETSIFAESVSLSIPESCSFKRVTTSTNSALDYLGLL